MCFFCSGTPHNRWVVRLVPPEHPPKKDEPPIWRVDQKVLWGKTTNRWYSSHMGKVTHGHLGTLNGILINPIYNMYMFVTCLAEASPNRARSRVEGSWNHLPPPFLDQTHPGPLAPGTLAKDRPRLRPMIPAWRPQLESQAGRRQPRSLRHWAL